MTVKEIPTHNPLTFMVEQNKVTDLRTSKTWTSFPNGSSFNGYELAYTMNKLANPGDAIGVNGSFESLSIGGGNTNQKRTVVWQNGPVHDLEIIGVAPDRASRIRGIQFIGDKGGADNIRFQNLTVANPGGSFAPIRTYKNFLFGLLRFYDITLEALDPGAWKGNGMKWGIRGHGPAQWDIRYMLCPKAQEHSVYADNLQGDSYFMYIDALNNGRTGIQLTNRGTSGPTGFGNVLLKKVSVRGNDKRSGGGSDITIVGQHGHVHILDCESIGDPNKSSGALVAWSDKGHGWWPDDHGFTTTKLTLENFRAVHPNADRDHVMLSGIGRAAIKGTFDVTGNKTALSLGGNKYLGGGVETGSFRLGLPDPKSQNPGWNAWRKIKQWKKNSDGQVNMSYLTDAEIDQLA
jgi:hypothetical protein